MDRRKVYIYKIPGDREFMSIACDCHMNQRTGEDGKSLFLTPPDRAHDSRRGAWRQRTALYSGQTE